MSRLLFALVACIPLFTTSSVSADQLRPNIIYILADDLGYGDLGCYGQKHIKTPRLDRLAASGMRFTQHYAGSAVCAPSRCVLLTGKHAGHAAIRGNDEWPKGVNVWKDRTLEGQRPLPAEETTIGELLQAAGYETACIGKWGLGTNDTVGAPNRQGFDHFFGYLCQRQAHTFFPLHLWRNEDKVMLPGNSGGDFWRGEDYSHDELTREALAFIKKDRDKPYFLYLPYTIPHVALQVPDDSLNEYAGQWNEPKYDGARGYVPHEQPRACYAAMISRMDRDIGTIVDLLKELGQSDNTLVIFSSDNGPTYAGGVDAEFFQSAGQFRGLKGSLYEGGIRVPMIAAWPGHIAAGSQTDLASDFADLLPTLTEFAHAETPSGIDGRSLVPTLTGKGDQQARDTFYWELNGKVAVRKGNWKLVRQFRKQRNEWQTELFDLSDDPYEQSNLAQQQPEVTEKMLGLIDTLRTESAVPKWQLPTPK